MAELVKIFDNASIRLVIKHLALLTTPTGAVARMQFNAYFTCLETCRKKNYLP